LALTAPKILFYWALRVAAACLLPLFCLSCGSNENKSSSQARYISIPATLNPSSSTLALLAPGAEAFTLVVSGCSSGFTDTVSISASSGSLRFFEGDRDCVVSLRSFSWDTKTWTKLGGGDFSGTNNATFVNNVDVETLVLKQASTVSNPISDTDAVQFVFQHIAIGDNKALIVNGNPSEITGQGGEKGPYFSWFSPSISVSLQDIDASGVPTLRVKLECTGTFTWNSPTASSTCEVGGNSMALSDVWVKLVDDSFSNGTTLTQNSASNIFGTPTTGAQVGNDNAFNSSGSDNGGFTVDVTAQSNISTCKSYLLILMRENAITTARSFQIFNVDMATSSTGCP
jgi:hypothetical protein